MLDFFSPNNQIPGRQWAEPRYAISTDRQIIEKIPILAQYPFQHSVVRGGRINDDIYLYVTDGNFVLGTVHRTVLDKKDLHPNRFPPKLRRLILDEDREVIAGMIHSYHPHMGKYLFGKSAELASSCSSGLIFVKDSSLGNWTTTQVQKFTGLGIKLIAQEIDVSEKMSFLLEVPSGWNYAISNATGRLNEVGL